MDPVSGGSDHAYWHPHTASVDWCEENYEVSRYVVEFYNTLSSLAMIFFGEFGARTPLVAQDARFRRVFRLIAVVGIGSVLFHATLKHSTQMMDELPMVWVISYSTYCILRSVHGVTHGGLPWLFALLTATATCAVTLTSGLVQFITFHLVYDTVQLLCLTMIVRVYLERRRTHPVIAGLARTGFGLFLVACLCWFVDTCFCPYVDGGLRSWLPFNLQLHAWWHVFVSLGFYYLCTFLVFDDQLRKHREPLIRYRWCILPEVILAPMKGYRD
ncbi:hypothetical protein IWQ60_010045 [Tieghemiomyces parasiticus]|uniref:Alkaline phytoceramidase n=1 Tax=Tieghemiomyces parasiticus TaxID=78921 RepID=A0A9W7ZM83_9FUNG|nr:hypothetical protein IWQ60_010045 [Tieghemiomyces parasiticus]